MHDNIFYYFFYYVSHKVINDHDLRMFNSKLCGEIKVGIHEEEIKDMDTPPCI